VVDMGGGNKLVVDRTVEIGLVAVVVEVVRSRLGARLKLKNKIKFHGKFGFFFEIFLLLFHRRDDSYCSAWTWTHFSNYF
jgi:hypothetical protein